MEGLILISIIGMITNQVVTAYTAFVIRSASDDGIDCSVWFFYSSVLAFLSSSLLSILLERKKWPKLTWKDLLCVFLCAPLGGPVPQNLNVKSFAFSSPKATGVVADLVPVIIFVLKLTFFREGGLSRSTSGIVKVVGYSIWTVGAVLPAVYKGPLIVRLSPLVSPSPAPSPLSLMLSSTHMKSIALFVAGVFMSIGGSSSLASWFTNVVQEKMSPSFSYSYTMSALMSFFSAIIAFTYSLSSDHHMENWKLGSHTTVLMLWACIIVFYSMLVTWYVQCKGTAYVAVFSNLSIIIDSIAGPLILQRELHLGSVLGVLLIICGVCFVHWATTVEALQSEIRRMLRVFLVIRRFRATNWAERLERVASSSTDDIDEVKRDVDSEEGKESNPVMEINDDVELVKRDVDSEEGKEINHVMEINDDIDEAKRDVDSQEGKEINHVMEINDDVDQGDESFDEEHQENGEP